MFKNKIIARFTIERTKELNDRFYVEPRHGAALQIPHYQYRRFNCTKRIYYLNPRLNNIIKWIWMENLSPVLCHPAYILKADATCAWYG
jgi:hypothetical protein